MIPCPGCGMGLRFDIEAQQMRCDYCDSLFDPYRFDPNKGDATKEKQFETYTWSCPACGGKLETSDQTDAMGFCPYCGGASLLYDRIRKQWRPDTVIPFSVTREQCKKAYLKEARKHPFVARRYKDPALLESFRGIYMPFWSFRMRHTGPFMLSGTAPPYMKGNYRITDHYNITGQIEAETDGYAHDAYKAFDDRISEDIFPFDAEKKKPFTPGFLSGFYTVIGDVSKEAYAKTMLEEAKAQIREQLEEESNDVRAYEKGYRLQMNMAESKIPAEILASERALYPVWFMSCRTGDRLTYAAVNGQTGKVSADFPASLPRILTFALVIAAALFALLLYLPSMKAGLAAFVVSAVFLLGNILLGRSFKRLCDSGPMAEDTPEAADFHAQAKAFKKFNKLWTCISVALCIVGFIIRVAEPAYNLIPYLFCLLPAALFVVHITRFIRIQLWFARRRPKMMNREGAAYDKN